MNRRDFVRIGGTTLFGLSLPDFFRAQAAAGGGHPQAKATQMVCVWLPGGPPHRDSFDPKPNAAVEFRGAFRTIPTSVPGTQVSELLPRMARLADKYTIIRSCTTGDGRADHGKDSNYWLTSNRRRVPQTPKYPTYGSVMARLKQAPTGVPSFILLGSGNDYLVDSYLGSAHAPLVFSQQQARAMQDMLTVPQVQIPNFNRETDLVRALNAQRWQLDQLEPLLEGRDQFQQRAFDMLRSARMAQALDVRRESARNLERYGATAENRARGGRNSCEAVLLARRLLEVGVPFVHVNMMSWDFHSENDAGCRNNWPSVDNAVSSLIEDLDQRGLLRTTIVALLGEMGRTPWVQGTNGGSDHWPTQFIVLAGGGFKGGAVVGATDARAAQITDKYYRVESFARTIYTHLGINPDQEFNTTDGRPIKIVVEDRPLIREAIA